MAGPDINPFEITVEESLERLRAAFSDTFCPMGAKEPTRSELTHLERMAPDWPKGKDAYRSPRIRFGEGRDGMIRTFEAHAKAVNRVHGKCLRWGGLLSGEHPYQGRSVDRLRLLAGNDSHKPVVEWFITDDLSAYRKRKDITSVRGSKSLADEGLVLAWLVPDRVRAIDYKEWCAWFCAGYELNVPEGGDESWLSVPCVDRGLQSGSVFLSAYWRSNGNSSYSVPSVG